MQTSCVFLCCCAEIDSLFFGLNLLLACLFDLRMEPEAKDTVSARRVQKADREKLRRDRLNEQFTELGNALGKSSFDSSI